MKKTKRKQRVKWTVKTVMTDRTCPRCSNTIGVVTSGRGKKVRRATLCPFCGLMEPIQEESK